MHEDLSMNGQRVTALSLLGGRDKSKSVFFLDSGWWWGYWGIIRVGQGRRSNGRLFTVTKIERLVALSNDRNANQKRHANSKSYHRHHRLGQSCTKAKYLLHIGKKTKLCR
jgi:hypothetical protein